jgi:hypothetical protein
MIGPVVRLRLVWNGASQLVLASTFYLDLAITSRIHMQRVTELLPHSCDVSMSEDYRRLTPVRAKI